MAASRFLCLIAGVDHQTVSNCPRTDRLWAHHLGAALALSFLVVTGIAYHATSYIIASVPMRGIAAVVIGLTILMFDRALFQADWFLQSVPPGSRAEASRWVRISVRLAISLCLSFVLALFLELAIFSDSINERLHADFRAGNAALFTKMDDYQALLDRQIADRSAYVAGLEAELSSSIADDADGLIQGFEATLLRLDQEIAAYDQDRQAELYGRRTPDGQTRRAGKGPAYRYAEAQIERLTRERRQVNEELHERRAALAEQRNRQRGDLSKAQEDLGQLIAGRDAALLAYRRDLIEASPEYQEPKDDPLARMAAYTELKKDPVEGPSIILVSWLLRSAVIFLEVAPLAAKMIFGPPTVYAAKVRADLERGRRLAYASSILEEIRLPEPAQAGSAAQHGDQSTPDGHVGTNGAGSGMGRAQPTGARTVAAVSSAEARELSAARGAMTVKTAPPLVHLTYGEHS